LSDFVDGNQDKYWDGEEDNNNNLLPSILTKIYVTLMMRELDFCGDELIGGGIDDDGDMMDDDNDSSDEETTTTTNDSKEYNDSGYLESISRLSQLDPLDNPPGGGAKGGGGKHHTPNKSKGAGSSESEEFNRKCAGLKTKHDNL